ncbi:MAG TPA: hypothetical protein H9711_01195, partial [Candidatus Mediterraneibacter intestinavium]|nr:hypothetical protein [Candidatus Mediterraneibacter intestinavium]
SLVLSCRASAKEEYLALSENGTRQIIFSFYKFVYQSGSFPETGQIQDVEIKEAYPCQEINTDMQIAGSNIPSENVSPSRQHHFLCLLLYLFSGKSSTKSPLKNCTKFKFKFCAVMSTY